MGNLIRYSALSAKISAMKSRFLTEEQFANLASQESVTAAVEYLKNLPAYGEAFAQADIQSLHRAQVEQLLFLSLYRDFSSLYKFAGVKQRAFLDLYFTHFEHDLLKKCLRNAAFSRESQLDFRKYEDFFQRHSKLDLIGLSKAASISEFINGLEGSFYYEPLKALEESGNATLFSCSVALDNAYFLNFWKRQKQTLGRDEKNCLEKCLGEKIDLLNLQSIARAVQNYGLTGAQILDFLVPINYHISPRQEKALSEAASEEDFARILKDTWYGDRISRTRERLSGQEAGSKRIYRELLEQLYSSSSRKNPYSAAILNAYFYFKEEEIRKITTAVEGIRYGLDQNAILSCMADN